MEVSCHPQAELCIWYVRTKEMPIYEYRCSSCGETFEQIRRIRDADLGSQCPKCESEEIERLFSAFATGGGCASGSRFT
jgi:putative FmdB family regulatory protein